MYTLTLSKEQIRVIDHALEIMVRMGLGQIHTAVDLCYLFHTKDPQKVRKLCDELQKELTGFEGGASWGIHSKEISEDYRIACDMEQVIRHQIYNDLPEETKQKLSYTVCAYPAHKTSTTEKLPKIEKST
jgi:dissimilatory sulfite reductase (desulfoviridin) alpha/beta subunit